MRQLHDFKIAKTRRPRDEIVRSRRPTGKSPTVRELVLMTTLCTHPFVYTFARVCRGNSGLELQTRFRPKKKQMILVRSPYETILPIVWANRGSSNPPCARRQYEGRDRVGGRRTGARSGSVRTGDGEEDGNGEAAGTGTLKGFHDLLAGQSHEPPHRQLQHQQKGSRRIGFSRGQGSGKCAPPVETGPPEETALVTVGGGMPETTT